MNIGMDVRVTNILSAWLSEKMRYVTKIIYDSEIDTINRAILLGKLQTDYLIWEINDFEEQFPMFKNVLSAAIVKYTGPNAWNTYYVWEISVLLHPHLLIYNNDTLMEELYNINFTDIETINDKVILNIRGFNNSVDIQSACKINLITWFDFASAGYIYPFKDDSYKPLLSNRYILDVNANWEFEKQCFDLFGAKDMIFFNIYVNSCYLEPNIYETLNTLGVRYGYVYKSFVGKYVHEELFASLKELLHKKIITKNVILAFLYCDFKDDELNRLDSLLSTYGIEYYLDRGVYYKAIKQYMLQNKAMQSFDIHRIG